MIWSSNSTVSLRSNNPVMVVQLLDTGNLVVRDQNSTNPNLIWESFDYPGNTLLPGMKFGNDFETGLQRSLTSWKSPDDPSIGLYTYKVDTNGYPQHTRWRGQTLLSRLGPWNGLGFSGFPKDIPNSLYSVEFAFNQKEIYNKYERISSVFQRIVLTWDGIILILHWIERTKEWIVYGDGAVDSCSQFAVCGPYGRCRINMRPPCSCMDGFKPKNIKEWGASDWSSGCEHKTPLNFVTGDGFQRISGVKLPDTRTSCGYISPEYAVHGRYSIKSDVFSFGVLVLEIINGKKNRDFNHEGCSDNLLGHAWKLYIEGKSTKLMMLLSVMYNLEPASLGYK
ncbi:hypothetical protein L1987_15803 [Smallanthus sonchifolius]|uniref:Uncharacterized protein n=1 Tax=Smallanthus sonchifolius TaxID=185202 RepID=A0ACB9J6L6_9ASTR|nr:hypothetical protein L1987_15803 [Smallanthus sonchifolius]